MVDIGFGWRIKYFTTLVIIFAICIIIPLDIQCQNYQAFKSIKENSIDSASLLAAESGNKFSVFEQVFLLRSNVDLDRKEKVKFYLISLAKDGFYLEDILAIKTINSFYLTELFNSDSIFRKFYHIKVSESKSSFEKDTICQAIEKIYNMDQDARKLGKLINNYGYINGIDSLNQILIEDILLSSKPFLLSHKAQDQLYNILLHLCRRMDDKLFNKIDSRLMSLVLHKNFHPVSYAFIVDERLKVNNSNDYPMYNFLSNEKLGEEKMRRIENARCLINAF